MIMNKRNLKYNGYTITFQEVPNEISLVINISGCPHKCEGCHSKYLWEYKGNYILENLDYLLSKYKNYITCVCIMGGDQNIDELINLFQIIKTKGYKTCLYSGLHTDQINTLSELFKFLDYIKIGEYDDNKGGLNNPNTNQIFYEIKNDKLINITYKFQKSLDN